MNLDELLRSKADSTKVKVIAGDLPEGFWFLDGSRLRKSQVLGSSNTDAIDLHQNVRKLDLKNVLDRDSFEPLVGAGVGALLGFRLFGPLGAAGGALAGHFLVHKQQQVSVGCELHDGRSFLATMEPKMFEHLRSFVTAR